MQGEQLLFDAIINHDNFKQIKSGWIVSLKFLEVPFCEGAKTKRPTRNSVCVRETPVKVCGGVCQSRQKILRTTLFRHTIHSNSSGSE